MAKRLNKKSPVANQALISSVAIQLEYLTAERETPSLFKLWYVTFVSELLIRNDSFMDEVINILVERVMVQAESLGPKDSLSTISKLGRRFVAKLETAVIYYSSPDTNSTRCMLQGMLPPYPDAKLSLKWKQFFGKLRAKLNSELARAVIVK